MQIKVQTVFSGLLRRFAPRNDGMTLHSSHGCVSSGLRIIFSRERQNNAEDSCSNKPQRRDFAAAQGGGMMRTKALCRLCRNG
jgi:hypothetical protein